MYIKVFVFLATICTIQSVNAGPISVLINDLKPRIAEATAKVANIVKNGGIKLGQTYAEIEVSISVLDRELGQQKNKVKESVEQAVSDAKISGKNIDNCVEKVADGLKIWNKRSLELCRNRPELNLLGVKLSQVGKLEGVLATAPIRCTVQNRGDVEKIKMCVEDIITDVETQAEAAAQEIDNTLNSALDEGKKCANNAASNLRNQLNSLNSDFSNCIMNA